jgi:hypothetical protein
MRMWCIDPRLLCRKHLLGEHSEIHKHRHNFVKHHKITGRIFPIVLIEPENMQPRHDQLVKEMIERGYNHQSPYEQPDLSHLKFSERYAEANIEYNLKDLSDRCLECRKRIENKGEINE